MRGVLGNWGAARDRYLVVDIPGSDPYLPGTACGGRGQPLAAGIDMHGDDAYESGGELGREGAGAGVAIVVDLRGNDGYLTPQRGGPLRHPRSQLAHVLEGDDRYVDDHSRQAVGLCGFG